MSGCVELLPFLRIVDKLLKLFQTTSTEVVRGDSISSVAPAGRVEDAIWATLELQGDSHPAKERECLDAKALQNCEGEGDVVGVKAQVVEVGVQVRVHQDRGVEEDGEGQVEVEREEDEDQGETLIMGMRMR